MGLIFTGTSKVKCYVADVPIDAKVSEVFTASAKVTKHPVEDGSDVADHIVEEPDGLQIEGIISNTPASLLDAIGRWGSSWAEDAFGELLAAKEARQPIAVITVKRDYENMVITRLVRTSAAVTGDSVQVSITLEKIRKVEGETVGAPKRPAGVQKPAKNLGKQPTKPATGPQSKTLAKTISDAVF